MQFYISLVHLEISEFIIIIFYFGNLYSKDAILFFHILETIILTLTKKNPYFSHVYGPVY